MKHLSPSLLDILIHQQWTREQKALMGTVGVLLGVKVLSETGLPWSAMQTLLQAIPKPFRKRQKGIQLGPLFLSEFDRVRHTHMVGPPGSGKTELTKLLCFEDIERGRGCFIIDPKGDRELYEEVKAFCKLKGREKDLKLLSATYPDESCTWNPCGLGNASELQSKFLNSNVYSEPHYAKACEVGLLEAFNELTHKKPSGFALPDLVRELKYLAEKQKSKDLAGLFYDFGSLSQCEWAEILCCNPPKDPAREISLLNIVQNNQILFVHLPTEGKSIQSSRIGRLLTQELILISGLRKSYPQLNRSGVFSVFIDEFDAFATDSFITYLNKGRSSNFMIHIAHQTLSDLKKISPEFAGQIQGNCNIHVIFRHDDPDDAEYWARFIGTKKVIKRTYQTQDGAKTGGSSNRETQEFYVSPDEIKSLGVGQCVLSIKTQKTHRKIKLPLPPKYAAQPNTQENEKATASVQSRMRGSVPSESEKTDAEKTGALSPELETQPSPQPNSKNEIVKKPSNQKEEHDKQAALEKWNSLIEKPEPHQPAKQN